VAAGLISPIDTLAEKLVSADTLQHLLIADFAAPFLLAATAYAGAASCRGPCWCCWPAGTG
jgi:cytochrome c oxidase assembly factor CtaG